MLEVRNVSVSYGRHRALQGTSLKVDKGQICVILGANGAGKSTLLKVIGGMVKSESGSVIMNGKDITTLKAHQIVEEGIALVPEGRGIFGDLTVAENLQLGAFAKRARSSETATLADIYRLFPRLGERKTQIARTMSGGEQQMVAIGRALMSKPDILMLDEPSLGLSPLLSQELFRALAEVAKTGVGILLVEQNARQSLKIAQRGYLIENGLVTGENTAAALMNDPAVVSAYLGGAKSGTAPAPKKDGVKPRFSLPSALRLPLSVDALGRAVSALAARAGRIQWAFVRALRRDAPPPSAFVGRYDPKTIPDPWAEIAVAEASAPAFVPNTPRSAAADAARLAESASDYALRASQRLAAHITSSRLTAPSPSAFEKALVRQELPEKPVAVNPETPEIRDVAPEPRPSLIGHNSGGLSIDDEDEPRGNRQKVDQPVRLSAADLAARAAQIQAAHIAMRRKGLAQFAQVSDLSSVTREPAGTTLTATAPQADSFADMATRAAARHAEHVARLRRTKIADIPQWQPPEPRKIGVAPTTAAPPANAADNVLVEGPKDASVRELVSRAASIQAAHIAKNRKGLTAYTIPTQPSLMRPAVPETDPARGDNH
ncbi:ABC transporter ATP-binding protein [Aquamicrobium sp. cd-1]|uniref:ABC transporter ATP-binding protein n=1 Tax=Aquamicrobium zhengzhouense TaxID=2781738 RepID=A0ABS0SHB5_9HYPH|nr:ABC transporter ATP-binding protein [Aquamicrobium zhengzhouense]